MLKIKYFPNKENHVKSEMSNSQSTLLWWALKGVVCYTEEVEGAIKELVKAGDYNMNNCWIERVGEDVSLFHTVAHFPGLFIPYNKFVDLLEQWKLVLEQQQNKLVYDHDYDELTIFADDDYNFTVMVDGKVIEKQN